MPNLEQLIKIVDAFNSLADAGSNAEDIVNEFTGADGSAALVAAVEQLDADLNRGFHEVIMAIDDEDLQNAWMPFSNSLTAMYNQSRQYLQDLQNLQSNAAGEYSINGGQSFTDWCLGSGDEPGALHTLKHYVDLGPYGTPPGAPSLSGMFTNLDSNQSALELWMSIAKAAQTSSDPLFAKGKGKTSFEQVSSLMDEVFLILCMAYYAHDGAVLLLNLLQPGEKHSSLATSVKANFGNVGAPNTVWEAFGNALQSLSTEPIDVSLIGCPVNALLPVNQVMQTALTGDQYPAEVAGGGGGGFPTLDFSALDYGPPNSFFVSFQFIELRPPGGPYRLARPNPEALILLCGTLATIDASLKLTIGTQVPPDNDPRIAAGWQKIDNGGTIRYVAPMLEVDYVSTLYVQAPSSSPGQVQVITGFKLTELGNRLALGLQFGVLDLRSGTVVVSDPTYLVSGWCGASDSYMPLPDDGTDLRPAGAFSLQGGLPVNRLGIVTNVALAGTAGNSQLGVNVQIAPPLYQAAFFQPTNLPMLVPGTSASS